MSYSTYFAIEKRMKSSGMDIDRAELIADFTEGRTESLKDLSPKEYKEFCQSINSLLGADTAPDKNNQMRRKVIAILCQCGYTQAGKPDMNRINDWCVTHGHGHCALNDYDGAGLQKLIQQASMMLKSLTERL